MNGERVTLGLAAICALALVAVLVTDRPAGAKRVPSVVQPARSSSSAVAGRCARSSRSSATEGRRTPR
jgi:hypothetical protein